MSAENVILNPNEALEKLVPLDTISPASIMQKPRHGWRSYYAPRDFKDIRDKLVSSMHQMYDSALEIRILPFDAYDPEGKMPNVAIFGYFGNKGRPSVCALASHPWQIVGWFPEARLANYACGIFSDTKRVLVSYEVRASMLLTNDIPNLGVQVDAKVKSTTQSSIERLFRKLSRLLCMITSPTNICPTFLVRKEAEGTCALLREMEYGDHECALVEDFLLNMGDSTSIRTLTHMLDLAPQEREYLIQNMDRILAGSILPELQPIARIRWETDGLGMFRCAEKDVRVDQVNTLALPWHFPHSVPADLSKLERIELQLKQSVWSFQDNRLAWQRVADMAVLETLDVEMHT